jgi:iron complex outermembrane receptor protein
LSGDNNTNYASVRGGRFAFLQKFTDNLENTLTGLVESIGANSINAVFLTSSLKPLYGNFAYASPLNLWAASTQSRVVGDTLKFTTDLATVTNTASYTDTATDQGIDVSFLGPILGYPSNIVLSSPSTYKSHRLSDELRLTSNGTRRVDWLLGIFYTHEIDPDIFLLRGTDVATGHIVAPTSPYFDGYTYRNSSIFLERAVFGDITLHFTDQVDGVAGVRYSANKQSFSYTNSGLLVGGVPGGGEGSSNNSALTYLATVTYKPASNTTIYARAASAYRPGGPNILDPQQVQSGAPLSFGADKLWNYELGWKGTAWNQRVSYSADAFYMDWTDIQLEAAIDNGVYVANGPSARSEGVEGTFDLVVFAGLSLHLSASYTDAKLTSDVGPPTNASSGTPLPYSPKYAAAAVVDYRLHPLDGVTPSIGLTYAYRDSYVSSFSQGGIITLPGYGSLDVRGGLEWENYRVIARIDNVTNKFALTDANYFAAYPSGTVVEAVVVRPRTYGLSVEYRF